MHRSTATLSLSVPESGCKWRLGQSLKIWLLEALRQHSFRSMSMLWGDIFKDPRQNHDRIAHRVCVDTPPIRRNRTIRLLTGQQNEESNCQPRQRRRPGDNQLFQIFAPRPHGGVHNRMRGIPFRSLLDSAGRPPPHLPRFIQSSDCLVTTFDATWV
jgi:hypothetical protein